MKGVSISSVLLFRAVELWAQVVFSEIMFNPEGDERYDEFVEILNLGEEPQDLTGWQLSDGTKSNNILPTAEGGAVLLPGQYGIILVSKYFSESRSYDTVIPAEALLLTIDASRLGANGLNNSVGERVSLLSHQGEEGAYTYTPDNPDGYSEEKIDPAGGDSPENWGNSRCKGGTPGRRNSITPAEFDLELVAASFRPALPSASDTLALILSIRNGGKKTADSFTVVVEEKEPFQRLLADLLLTRQLPPGETTVAEIMMPPFADGEYLLRVTLRHPLDENPANDSTELTLWVESEFRSGGVVINEVMYDTDEKSQEWLELLNCLPQSVNLQGWSLSDCRKTAVINESVVLLPHHFAVVANQQVLGCDSAAVPVLLNLPELNNSGDDVILRDNRGRVIDSLSYRPAMGGSRNRSLERIRSDKPTNEPSNWGGCVDSAGATPGKRNSIAVRDYDLAVLGDAVRFHPSRPISANQLTVEVPIVNCGLQPVDSIAVRLTLSGNSVYDDSQSIRRLEAGDTAAVLFSLKPPEGHLLFDLCCSARRDERTENNAAVAAVYVSPPAAAAVINEIFYNPPPGVCEAVELFNNHTDTLDLRSWRLSDADTAAKVLLSDAELLLPPQSFLVIARDSSLNLPPDIHCLIVKKLPSLANDADAVILFDANGAVHERADYQAALGGSSRSLERVRPDVSSEERSNWMTCVDPAGHTLGCRNSVTVDLLPQRSMLQTSPNPFSPDGDGVDDVVGVSYSLPFLACNVDLKIFDIAGRRVRFLLNNEPSGAERTVFWDGRDDNGKICRMGIYILLLEARDNAAGARVTCRATVVLAGRL